MQKHYRKCDEKPYVAAKRYELRTTPHPHIVEDDIRPGMYFSVGSCDISGVCDIYDAVRELEKQPEMFLIWGQPRANTNLGCTRRRNVEFADVRRRVL